jgi:chromosome segregation ATPase
MGKLVGVCVVLFMLAFGFLFVTEAPVIAALFSALWAEPLLDKVAWAILVLVPLVLLPSAVWLCDTLVRQRKAANALELRLDGVRQGARELAKSQIDAEAAVHHLARTDPEDAIGALQQRITEAERFAQVQQSRSEIGDLKSRVDELRAQQDALKQRLAPVLDTRRSVEQLFIDLDSRQSDIERALAEIASGDDAVALDIRLKGLIEFVRQSHFRCDQIEQASKTIATLKEGYAELRTRLAPFAAAEDGVTSRVRELGEARDQLNAEITALQRTPEGALADHVQSLAESKTKLDGDLSQLNGQFSKLATLRKDVAGFIAGLDRSLNALSIGKKGHSAADIDARVDELSRFVGQTQTQFDDIEGRVAAFQQLRTKLAELQARLVPLESDDGGVAMLIAELQVGRDRLVAKISRIEGEEGELAARVKVFAQTKKELEERVASLSDQFTKLATIRSDITGLFEKLSSAVGANSNGSTPHRADP